MICDLRFSSLLQISNDRHDSANYISYLQDRDLCQAAHYRRVPRESSEGIVKNFMRISLEFGDFKGYQGNCLEISGHIYTKFNFLVNISFYFNFFPEWFWSSRHVAMECNKTGWKHETPCIVCGVSTRAKGKRHGDADTDIVGQDGEAGGESMPRKETMEPKGRKFWECGSHPKNCFLLVDIAIHLIKFFQPLCILHEYRFLDHRTFVS